MKEYIITKTDDASAASLDWLSLPCAAVEEYPWGGDYRPATRAWAVWSDSAIYVNLVSCEKDGYMRAQASGISRDVWQDSCMEFFLQPDGEGAPYLNLEFNSTGALYVGAGRGREDNVFLENTDLSIFGIKPVVYPPRRDFMRYWAVTARVPLDFLSAVLGCAPFAAGKAMRGNFFKCGESTPAPHYGTWNPVVADRPDFHRPECFGSLILG